VRSFKYVFLRAKTYRVIVDRRLKFRKEEKTKKKLLIMCLQDFRALPIRILMWKVCCYKGLE
jgi:hypothetical protein